MCPSLRIAAASSSPSRPRANFLPDGIAGRDHHAARSIRPLCTQSASLANNSAVDPHKKAPPLAALEPRTLELIHRHRRFLTERNHPGLQTGLLFPSEAGTRPVGNDQLNDVWREVQVMAGIERPVTVHGIRHTFQTSPGSRESLMPW